MNQSNDMVQYYDSYSILIINQQSKMRRVYTPFKVLCIESIDELMENSTLYVDEVFEDEDDLLLYKICGNLYAYNHFTIQVKF